ncbi:MAG: hypothetical protein ACI31A_00010, partial [Candidatus Limisoma sp.]
VKTAVINKNGANIFRMKQTIKYLAMLMVLLSFGLTSTSCSDDDDDVKDPEKPTLIGSWEVSGDWGSEVWTFDADGTFMLIASTNVVGSYSAIGNYTYDESTEKLVIDCIDSDDGYNYIWYYKVMSLTSEELVVCDEESSLAEPRTFTRKK